MRGGPFLLAALLPLLGACNMAISGTPMFTDADRSAFSPKDGIWLNDDPECVFDSAKPEAAWPVCAGWLVVRESGREFWMNDGKGQSERGYYLIAGADPAIVQVKYTDEAKDDGKTFYVFFGLEREPPGADGRFGSASTWEVKCGVRGKSVSDISPFAGISPECRPLSKDAIRSAAQASRATAEMAMRWRWLRPEGPSR